MKLHLTNYDPSEYLIFQDFLNNLSKKGYNCKNVDIFTFFKKDNQQYYYKTDLFVPINKNISLRRLKEQWLNDYIDNGYEYVGRTRKIYVFRSKKKNDYTGTEKELLTNYFKRNRTFMNFVFIFLAVLFSYLFIPNVFTNLNPSEFVSNGSIILHYVPLLLCISLLCRFMFHYLATEVLKSKFKRKINIINNKTFVFNNWLFIISIVLIVVGLGLDYFERKNEPVNDEIISLADLGYPGDQKTYDTCITSSSFLIDNSVSYSETNGEEVIKVNYYQYSDKSKATQGLENYQSSFNYSFKKEISNGYLLGEGEEEIYNVIAFVKDNQLIVLQSNLDLLANNLYETVIEKA